MTAARVRGERDERPRCSCAAPLRRRRARTRVAAEIARVSSARCGGGAQLARGRRLDLALARSARSSARPGRAGGLHELEEHVLREHAPAAAVAAVEPLVEDDDGDGEDDQARDQRGEHRVRRPERPERRSRTRRRARSATTPTPAAITSRRLLSIAPADYPGRMTALTDALSIGRRRAAQPGRARAARRDRQLVRAPAGAPLRRRPGRLGDGLELRASTTATRRPAASCCGSTRASATAGRSSIQLFGADPDVMRSAAATRRRGGRRPDRHQHGLPGAEGLPHRRRRGAARRRRPRGRGRARRRARAAACRSRSSCARAGARASATASRSRGGSSTRPAWRRSRCIRGRRRRATAAAPTTRSPPSSCARSTRR